MLNRNCTDALYQCAALIANTIYESPTEVCLLVFGFDLVIVLWEVLSRLYKYAYRKSRSVNSRALGLRTLVDGMVGRGGIEPHKSFETGYEPVGFSIRHIYP